MKLKVFNKNNKEKDFRLVQNLTMGEAVFNQFMQLRNQLVNAAENSGTEEKLSPLLIPTITNNMDEQLKLFQKLFELAD